MATYDAFVASAPEDGRWTRQLAARLKALNLDVFLDEMHIAPGEVVIHRVEDVLLSSATAILVCSRASLRNAQVRDEYAAMVTRAGDGLQRLIPVVLHDVVIPPLVASRGVIDFRDAESGPLYEAKVVELAIAIVHGIREPDWITLSPEAIRDRFVVRGPRSAHLTVSNAAVDFECDGRTTSGPHRFDPDRFEDLLWSFNQARDNAAVYRGVWHSARTDSPAEVALGRIGAFLGEAFLTGRVGEALCADIDIATARGASLRLGVRTSGSLPAALPWEMTIPPGRTVPLGLDPAVEIYRETDCPEPTPVAQVPAPLRVLAVLAAPDDDDLDLEDEQRRLLDAFDSTQRGADVHIQVQDEGTLDGIRDALSSQEFHILHLACHARPGRLLLESEDGTGAEVEASAFVAALPPNRRPPLVVLSGCSTALDADDLRGLACSLIAAGVAQVLAMTAAVSDMFAREFCELFYRELALAQRPEVLPALTRARQLIERSRADDTAPEWPTPALYMHGTSIPLYTLGQPQPPERLTPPDPYVGPDIPLRAIGAFVGRRFDLRALVAAVCAGPGVLIHGIGGVGKSSLAAELLRRLRADAGLIVPIVGRADPDTILTSVASALLAEALRVREDKATLFRRLSDELRMGSTPWRQRLDALARILFSTTRITLLLDNADANATIQPTGSASLDDTNLAEFLNAWISAPGNGRLVLTSRVPIALDGLHSHHLGPLSVNETRRLMWRFPALRSLPAAEYHRTYLTVGGHPRTIEILDALLRRGATNFAEVRQRLERLLRERGVGDPQRWMAERPDNGLDTALAEAITLAIHDSLLDSLLDLVAQEDLDILDGLAVCQVPADFYLIKTMLIDGGAATLTDRLHGFSARVHELATAAGGIPDGPPGTETVDEKQVAASLQRLTNLGLVTHRVVLFARFGFPPAEGVDRAPVYSMHPWTAERIRALHSDRAANAHHRLAYSYTFRAAMSPGVSRLIGETTPSDQGKVVYLMLAWRHAHAAGDMAFAILVLYEIRQSLLNMGWYDQLEQLYQETYAWTANNASNHMLHHRITILVGLSQINAACGRYRTAKNYASQALELAPASHDMHRTVLYQLAESYLNTGQHDRAAATFQSIIDLAPTNDRTTEAIQLLGLAYYGLGMTEEDRDNPDIAESALRRALELFEHVEDRPNATRAKHGLGNAALSRGDLVTADRLFHEALEVFLETGDRICTVRCYAGIGDVARQRGHLRTALAYQRQALTLAQQIGDADGIQRAQGALAEMMRQRGSRDLEVEYRRLALEQAIETGSADDAHYHFIGLSDALNERGDQAQLAAVVAKGRAFFEQAGDSRGLITAYTWTGRLAEAAEATAEAKSAYLRALGVARETNADGPTTCDLLFRLADLTQMENPGQAAGFYRSALDLNGDQLTAESARELGTEIVRLTINEAGAQLHHGPPMTSPHQLASVYAGLASNLAHLPGQERAATIHRIAAHLLALSVGTPEQAEWQRLLVAADVHRAGRDVLPGNCVEFIAALTAISGSRYKAVLRMPGHEGVADTTYKVLINGLGPLIADLLPPHLTTKWLPPVTVAVAATLLVSDGRGDEYETQLRPALDQEASDEQACRVVTALKHRIAGEDWRPLLPCDLTYLVMTMYEQQLASFLETRSE